MAVLCVRVSAAGCAAVGLEATLHEFGMVSPRVGALYWCFGPR